MAHLCPFGSVLHVRVLLRSSLPAPLHIDAVRLLLRDRDSVDPTARVRKSRSSRCEWARPSS